MSFLLFHITFNLIPQINYLIDAINSEDCYKVTKVAPKILMANIIILAAVNILIHQDKIKILVTKIKLDWHEASFEEFPNWNQRRTRIIKMGNKWIFCTLCIIHSMSIALYYIPNTKLFLRYLFDDLDPRIDRETLLKVK